VIRSWRKFSLLFFAALLAAGCGGGDPDVISGEIRVAADLSSEIPRNSLLVIRAHRPGSGRKSGNPPVAEQRVRNPKFPLKYFLGPPDAKGAALSGPLVISARLFGDELSGDTVKPIAFVGQAQGSANPGRRDVDIMIRNQEPMILARARTQGRKSSMRAAPRTGRTASSGGAGTSISGTIRVSPALSPPSSGGVLFIIVRPGGAAGGPPLAVKRVRNTGFPLRYEVNAENVMIAGVPFQGPVNVKVRLDGDGKVGTAPGDLEGGSQGAVKVGDRNVDITLDKRH
jgi:hypothetical protein